MVVRPDDTCRVQEADNDEAADAPAWETDQETQQVLDEALLAREDGVGTVSHRVDAWDTHELLSQIFSVVFDHVVVPEDVESTAMSSPGDQEDSAPERHHDGEHASKGRILDAVDHLDAQRYKYGQC